MENFSLVGAGGLLAYKMVKLTPCYASLSLRKAVQFLNKLYSKQIFTILLKLLWILNTWGKKFTDFNVLHQHINQLFSTPKLLRAKLFSNKISLKENYLQEEKMHSCPLLEIQFLIDITSIFQTSSFLGSALNQTHSKMNSCLQIERTH